MTNTPKDVVTTNLVVGKKESVTDQLLLLNPVQIPLLSRLGIGAPTTQTTHIWYEDEMFGTKTVVTEEATADATELTVADVEPFREGHIVMIGEEYVKVTKVNAGEKKLTVERGYADTEAGEVTADTEIEVQFLEGAEGMDAVDARYKPRKKVSNVTQIFTDTIRISGTQLAVENHNIDNIYNYELDKLLTMLGLQLENAVLNGVEAYVDGIIRKMRGIRNFVKTNVMEKTGEVTLDKIQDALGAIKDKGGFANGGTSGYVIMVPAPIKRAISKFGIDYVRTDESSGRRGTKVDVLVTEYGEFPVVLNDNMRKDEILILDENRLEVRPLRGREFTHEYLGKVGDRVEGMVVGEYTVEVQQEKAHALLKGVETK